MKLSWLSSGKKTGDAPDALNSAPARKPRNLLMATDLSSRSNNALARSLELAATHDAKLTVLHVLDEDLPAATQARVADAAKEEIQDCIAKTGRAESVDVSVEVIPGKDYQDILRTAEAKAADLIITGVHRNESGNRPISGTTMERVIRKGAWPVLVVCEDVKSAYQKLVIAVDFSAYSRFAIRNAVALAPKAEFYLVHAFMVPFAGFQSGQVIQQEIQEGHEKALANMIEEEMDTLIKSALDVPSDLQNRFHRIVRCGDINAVLTEEIKRLSPDLLVLGTHGRVGIAHAVLGSVAERFLNHPPCDVMAVKAW